MKAYVEIANRLPAVQRKAASEGGLPDNLKSGIESLSGIAMDDVRVHYNSDKPAQLQAHAFAQGSDIHLAAGQERHLPHEAWHVVQQRQGRVKPTLQLKGVAVNDDTGLEKEADVMGARAVQGVGLGHASIPSSGPSAVAPVAQGKFKIKGGNDYDSTASITDEVVRRLAPRLTMANQAAVVAEIKKLAASGTDHGAKSWDEVIAMAVTNVGGVAAAPAVVDMDYESDHDEKSAPLQDQDAFIKARGALSPQIHQEFGDKAFIATYRDSSIKLTNSHTQYSFTSTAKANLLSGKGYSVGQSHYHTIFKDAASAADISVSALSGHLKNGLLDTKAFSKDIVAFTPAAQNKIQYVLSLLINEILGRSTTNFIEIVAMLQKTETDDDDDLTRRMEQRGTFIPNAKEHKGIGGSKLSRIGHGDIDVDNLDKSLREVVSQNMQLYQALADKLDAKSFAELSTKVLPLIKKFVKNIEDNFKVQ